MLDYDGDGLVSFKELRSALDEAASLHDNIRWRGAA